MALPEQEAPRAAEPVEAPRPSQVDRILQQRMEQPIHKDQCDHCR